MQALSKERDFAFTILVAPLLGVKENLNDITLKQGLTYSEDVAVEGIEKRATAVGLEFLYPNEAFIEAAKAGEKIHSPEGHYGPMGNKLIAQAVLRHCGCK